MLPTLGALFLNYEEDLRAQYDFQTEELSGEINALSGSVRQVFADDKGDRLTLFLQVEAEHNFEELMAHQFYAKYKGPMGKWNLALGRVPLPFGLLTGWSPDRQPYRSPYTFSKVMKVDNGLLIDGTIGMVDYGLAITQGFGMSTPDAFPGDGLLTGRFGLSPLIGGELQLGLSGSVGTSHRMLHGHGDDAMKVEHRTALFDLTALAGRGTYRLEAGAEMVDEIWTPRGFLAAEYQLLPKLTLIGSGNVAGGDDPRGTLFGGVATTLKSVTIRGGYSYEQTNTTGHALTLQLYRQLSLTR